MITSTTLSRNIAIVSGSAVLLALFALHLLSPEFDPSWRMVSEYANGQHGWLLSLMFLLWAISSFSVVAVLSKELTTKLGKVGLALLITSGIGEVMAAFFDINHSLHGLSALIGIGSFPFAATIISHSLAKVKKWQSFKKPLLSLAYLSWLSVVGMIASFALLITTYMQAGGDMSGGAVAEIPDGVIAIVGWANRLLIIVYTAWLLTAAWAGRSIQKRTD